MRIGIGIPFKDQRGEPLDAAGVATRAGWIEDEGFNGVWMGDASFRGLATWPDPFLWLLAAGAATRHVELGTAIYQVPLRNPVALAQRMLTLQALTNGRFSAGVGPGSTELGHAAVGVEFGDRFRIFRDAMTTIRQLCAGETVGDANLAPWPQVAGGPRFLLGAWHGGANLKRAVTDYDGWLCSAGRTTLGTMVEGIARYRDLGGKRAMVASCSVDLTAESTPLRDDEPFSLRCPPAEAADRLARVAELGFDDILLTIRDSRHAKPFDSDFTREQLAEVRGLLPRDPAPVEPPRHQELSCR